MNSRKGTTKSGGKKHVLDKFYTAPEVAKTLIDSLPIDDYNVIIEPSAGSGSFSNQIEGCVAFDLEPEHPSIQQQDFFLYERERDGTQKVMVLGNPPFGQQNSLTVRFINHAAKFADSIAFILPVSFKKASVQKRLDKHLHLVKESELPKNSFTLEGAAYDVPCVFQVWEWREELRVDKVLPTTHSMFTFVKDRGEADCRIQRVGGRAGKADTDLTASAQSNYFVKVNVGTVENFVETINALSIPGKDHSVGPRTISKSELVAALEVHLLA